MNSIIPLCKVRVSLAIVAFMFIGGTARAQCSEWLLEPVPGTPLIDRFGSQFAVSGDAIVVGNTDDDTLVSDGGNVHVFQRQGPGWVRTDVLYPQQPVPFYSLGQAVAICGDTLFAGTRAYGDEGSVLVYERQAGAWSNVQEIRPLSNPFGDARFGRFVHLTDDEAVILAPGDERIYFFESQGGLWAETAWVDHTVLQPYYFDPQQNVFASQIAVHHDRIVIANLSGPVFVIERDATGTWSAIAELSVPGVSWFNHLVAIQDGTVAVGYSGGVAGVVFVFEEGPGSWSHTQTLFPSNMQPNQGFSSPSFSGESLLVGSGSFDSQVEDSGAVYVFENLGGSWTEIDMLQPAVPLFRARFGSHLTLWGDQGLIGAPGPVNAPPTYQGALHVIDLAHRQGTAYCATNPNSTGQPAGLTAVGNRRAVLSCLTFDVAALPPNQFGYFAMARGQGFLPLVGGGSGNFCLALPFVRLANNIQLSNPSGTVSFAPNLGALPGGFTIAPGESWSFQYWTRDGATSNLSNGLAITFATGDESAVQFPVTASSAEEETTSLEVEVTLSEPTHTDVSIAYTTGGTATYNVDWRVEESNPLVIPAGELSSSMTLVVAEDMLQEGDETAVVTLGAPSGGVLGTASVFTLTIVDDD